MSNDVYEELKDILKNKGIVLTREDCKHVLFQLLWKQPKAVKDILDAQYFCKVTRNKVDD